MSIVKRDAVSGYQDFSFPIDDSILDFDVVLYGDITSANLADPLGELLLYASPRHN